MADRELTDVFDNIGAGISLNTSTTRFPARLADGSLKDYSAAQIRAIVSGGDVASAMNTDLSTFAGKEANITGTTQIEGFTVISGEADVLVNFADVLTLKYDATNLPMQQSDADIKTQPGDKAIIGDAGGGVGYIKQYIRKSGVFIHPAIFHCRTVAAVGQNVNIATGLNNGDALNGVTLATDDIVFLPWQTAAEENGIYVVGASPARHPSFATYNSYQNTFIKIDEGDQDATSVWLCSSSAGGTIDVDDLDFELIVGRIGAQSSIAEFVKLINTGLYMKALSGDYYTLVRMGDAQTAARSLIIYGGDADHNVTVVGNPTIAETYAQLTPVAFADLPASPAFGMIAAVNDAASDNPWGDVVTSGGGGRNIIVWYDGTDWRIMGGKL